jgi:hypothetical protein
MRSLLVFLSIILTLDLFAVGVARAECFDPAIEAGFAAKDPLTESLVVTQLTPTARGAKWGDTIAGIAVKGQYFGCRIKQAAIARVTTGKKKFSLYLPLRDSHVQGFEIDISTESRRILASRAIQVPWEVVDRTQGVTGACSASTPTTFEGFLYGALRNAKSRRCTQAEISAFVGQPRPRPKKSR